jgi:hypothetical protein
MKKILLLTVMIITGLVSQAQFILNPKVGLSFMNLTDPPDGYDYKADIGYQLGCDARFGQSLFIQPGIFYTKTQTAVIKEDIVQDVEDNIVRNSLYLKAMLGFYLIKGETLKLRINAGPGYDVMMSAESKDDKIPVSEDAFSNGTFNLELGGGIDIGFLSLDLGYMYGLSKAYDGDKVDIDSKYMGLYLNAGVVLKFGDQE